MVAFNPDIGDLPSAGMPDQTGASRGSIPDQSFEAMFKGIGSTIEGATKLADNTVQQFISHDTRTAYEAEMKPVTDSVPVEMKNGIASLESLQAALEQGKISDVYFYGQLTAMSKGLRAKYPGYEDYVDQSIQSITGVRPANAFRDAVLAEQASNEATLRNEENKWDTWEKQNEAVILQLFPDYFNDPSKYSRESIRQGVASKKSELAQIDQINSETTMLLNQGRLTDEQAKENATVGLNQTVNTFMTGTANAMGFNGSDAMKQIARMQTEGYTDEEYAGLMAQMNQVEGALRYQMSQYLNNPLDPSNPESSFAVILGNEGTAANTLIENAMAPFNAIKQMIVNKEFGLASYYTNLNANMQSKDFNSILNASPELRIANGLSQISPDLAQLFITEGGRQEGIFSQMVPELVARQAIGVDTFEEQVERIIKSTSDANSKSSGINTLIDTSLTSIVSGQLAPDQLANAVNGIYGYDDNRSTIFENVNPNDRNRLFTRMYSPEVTQAIVKSGDRKSLMTYYESALENINGIPEFRRAAGTIESMQNWSDKLQLSVNPSTGQIVLNASEMEKAMPEFGAGSAMTRQKIKTLQEGIDSLNNVFSTISPMLDGLEVDEAMKPSLYGEVLKQLNVDLEDGKKDGFFEWVGKTLSTINTSLNTIDPDKGLAAQMGPETFDFSNLPESPSDLDGTQPSPENLAEFLASSGADDPVAMAKASSPIGIARAYIGSKETDGEGAKVISAFIKKNAGIDINPQTTAWCAAFLDAVLGGKGTGQLNARSYLTWGNPVNDPKVGDVVVLRRPGGEAWQGHVGLFAGFDDNGDIRVLGGNQSDSVSVDSYNKDDLLAFRRATM